MAIPYITAFYAALGALLVVLLAFRVVRQRLHARVGVGVGSDPVLERRVRIHANAVENLPLALLLLLLLELLLFQPWLLHLFGAGLLLGRILHAWGLSTSAGTSPSRFSGALLTWLIMVVMAMLLLWQVLLFWSVSA